MSTLLLYSTNVLLSILGVGSTGKIINEYILTIVSITIVFTVLTCLVAIYLLIGKLISNQSSRAKEDVFVGMKAQEEVHDKESYIITIKRKGGNEVEAPDYISRTPYSGAAVKSEAGIKKSGNGKSGHMITSPLPGVVLDVKVKAGQEVSEGDVMAVIEAMKMENDIEAEVSGVVKSVNVTKGDTVLEGAVIVVIE